jgi:phosphopantothenoylcysteine decarboxylase/phosphopantothenate--cysteine ligase
LSPITGKRIVLIVAGGIAAYKSLDLIRRLREEGADIKVVMTEGAKRFVTPLSFAALSGNPLSDDLFSLEDDMGMAHINLSRHSDLLLVAPATADILAKMATGLANDLATTALLASDKPILVAPSMNLMMWAHPATQANFATLLSRGVHAVGPGAGDLACGEVGDGRMAEVPEIIAAVRALFQSGPLVGKKVLVTAGPTYEAIDPVRFIGNRSSGKQGYAIAQALERLGAAVTLVSGPVNLPDPPGMRVVRVDSAKEMLTASEAALPVDLAVCAAAVADWRVAKVAPAKLKKSAKAAPPTLDLATNPDILASLAKHKKRPKFLVGFAAETEDLVKHAKAKLAAKGCDLIVANDVSQGSDTFGGENNKVTLVENTGVTEWPKLSKTEVADHLAALLAERIA